MLKFSFLVAASAVLVVIDTVVAWLMLFEFWTQLLYSHSDFKGSSARYESLRFPFYTALYFFAVPTNNKSSLLFVRTYVCNVCINIKVRFGLSIRVVWMGSFTLEPRTRPPITNSNLLKPETRLLNPLKTTQFWVV